MEYRQIATAQLDAYRSHMIREEKSMATLEKYLRDVHAFFAFMEGKSVTKEAVLAYKQHLQSRGYAARTVNSKLAAVNSLLAYLGWQDCRVKTLKLQQQIYCAEEKELTRAEYLRLLEAARGNPQLQLVMQTICCTGIRVSELCHFTLEQVSRGEVVVNCKAKTRTILLPSKLRTRLLRYARQRKIRSGQIFLSRKGTPLRRTAIWAGMKALCSRAGVALSKVYPHNLRKLFARTFYTMEKDIAKLADILGHSSINTTRIYIISTGREHRRKLERLGLLL